MGVVAGVVEVLDLAEELDGFGELVGGGEGGGDEAGEAGSSVGLVADEVLAGLIERAAADLLVGG